MNPADELAHQIKHAATQQAETYRPDVYGHVSSYDPATHRVRLVIPSLGDGDGNYVLTGWMPLGTIAAGNGWGVQIAPMGGASVQNPTAGEKCKISIIERNYGVALCAEMCFDQVYTPPFTDLQPGEIGMQAASGSFLRFHASGQVELNLPTGDLTATVAQGNINATAAQGDVNVTASQGNAAVTATQGNATVSAPAGIAQVAASTVDMNATDAMTFTAPKIHGSNGAQTLWGLMLSTIVAKFNAHTHPVGAGDSGPPSVLFDPVADVSQTFESA
jgi:hypothetical protein